MSGCRPGLCLGCAFRHMRWTRGCLPFSRSSSFCRSFFAAARALCGRLCGSCDIVIISMALVYTVIEEKSPAVEYSLLVVLVGSVAVASLSLFNAIRTTLAKAKVAASSRLSRARSSIRQRRSALGRSMRRRTELSCIEELSEESPSRPSCPPSETPPAVPAAAPEVEERILQLQRRSGAIKLKAEQLTAQAASNRCAHTVYTAYPRPP